MGRSNGRHDADQIGETGFVGARSAGVRLLRQRLRRRNHWTGFDVDNSTDASLTTFGLAGIARVRGDVLASVRDDGTALRLLLVDVAEVVDAGFVDPSIPDLADAALPLPEAPISVLSDDDRLMVATEFALFVVSPPCPLPP